MLSYITSISLLSEFIFYHYAFHPFWVDKLSARAFLISDTSISANNRFADNSVEEITTLKVVNVTIEVIIFQNPHLSFLEKERIQHNEIF